MPLTPEDVRNKQFSTVRLREGYEMDEVDAFLDEVEAELTRLLRENEDLHARLAAAARQPVAPPAPAVEAPAPPPAPVPVAAAAAAAAPAVAPTDSAVRMLELAQRTADEHVAQAKAEADRLVSDARLEAQRVTHDLEREHTALEAKVAELKAFEREYRTRLRTYLEGQLRDLDQMGGVAPTPPAPGSPASAAGGPATPPAPTPPEAPTPQPPGPHQPAPSGPPPAPSGAADTTGSARPATPFAPPSAVPSVAPPAMPPSGPPLQPPAGD
ncbi:MAG: DivIVA domain-containing protein [Actinomycetia bacterium]|jgi:DivIVA domain-containing protein|nr:DivIVA domain-containing protein [Actinomycetes bacterium]